jgi:hypothetical protein
LQKNKLKMKISFTNIDGKNVAEALVEIPERIFNMFPIKVNDVKGEIDIPHVKANTFTRVMGDVAISFIEKTDKLPIPEAKSNGSYTQSPAYVVLDSYSKSMREYNIKANCLSDLGFQRRGPAKWWSPVFGEDKEQNWMDFDMKTDELYVLIPKLFRSGYVQGQRKVRFDIKKALDISLI